jgi:hypothetical protein
MKNKEEKLSKAVNDLYQLWLEDEEAICKKSFDNGCINYNIICKYFNLKTTTNHVEGSRGTSVYISADVPFNDYAYEESYKVKEWSWKKFRMIEVEHPIQYNILFLEKFIEKLYSEISKCRRKDDSIILYPLPYLINKQQ